MLTFLPLDNETVNRSRMTKWCDLLWHRLNVPDFVWNPYRKFYPYHLIFMREFFWHVPKVMLLSEKNGVEQIHRKQSLLWAVNVTRTLEEKGHTVIVAEDPDVEFEGDITLREDGSGFLKIITGRDVERRPFLNYNTVEPLQLRYILRTFYDFLVKSKCVKMRTHFGWIADFRGTYQQRYLIYDFFPLAKD